jgi:hypothetical protein
MTIYLSNQPPNSDGILFNINGKQLERVCSVKYLGVEIDERLTFGLQTMKAVAKAKQGIGALSRSLRKWSSMEVLKTSITTIALPCLMYAIDVWYPPSIQHQQQIERVQKYAARLLTNNFNHETSYEELLMKLKWKPIFRNVAERRLITLMKYLDGSRFIPDYVFQIESEGTTRTSARLKEKADRHQMMLKTWSGRGSVREENLAAGQSRKMWNSLKKEVVESDVKGFIKKVKSDCVYEYLCDSGAIVPLTRV